MRRLFFLLLVLNANMFLANVYGDEIIEDRVTVYNCTEDLSEYIRTVAELNKRIGEGKLRVSPFVGDSPEKQEDDSGEAVMQDESCAVLLKTAGLELSDLDTGSIEEPVYKVEGPDNRYTLYYISKTAAERVAEELSMLSGVI